ncbi:YggS family pyridoxal phosphate-dependent enzyme [Jiulongibacter sediminis]|jgi:pyridoxal phosphate enzyme (YggS family)|uniref:YggS family pyridoxal phosphate-dependent enzyme n=1 Tax=Jiulongibacter sediminis TaxID=1605367 RepID=UPI0026EF817A|nr:YggS family pyridoxal phosphate-dependent enzyme [Jiulongibacter sediminis]
MSIAKSIAEIEEKIGGKAKLIAVSKKQPNEKLLEAYKAGFKRLGENYVQELCAKQEELPKDIEWHMIGHLQSNKVKYIAPFVHMIHSVDSFKLLKEINKQARKNERTIDCLLQIFIAEEDSKTGMEEQELWDLLANPALKDLENVRICGLMGMSTFTENTAQVEKEFRNLKRIFDKLKEKHPELPATEISMGMSGDWPLAINCGSTMIRVGSAIFGARQ